MKRVNRLAPILAILTLAGMAVLQPAGNAWAQG